MPVADCFMFPHIMHYVDMFLSPYPSILTLAIFISLTITVILVLRHTKERSDHYVGAVVEFAPTESDAFETPKEVLQYEVK